MSDNFRISIAVLVILILAMCSVEAKACSFYQVGMWSKHFSSRHDSPNEAIDPGRSEYNEVNKSLGCENILGSDYSVTIYENSYYNTSVWAYKEHRTPITSTLTYGYDVGVLTGYKHSVVPMVFGVLDWEGEVVGGKLIMFWGGVALQTKLRF